MCSAYINVIMIVLFLFRYGHLSIVQFLVDGQHCNLEAKDKDGMTAIHWAAWYVYQQCYYSYNVIKKQVIRYGHHIQLPSIKVISGRIPHQNTV